MYRPGTWVLTSPAATTVSNRPLAFRRNHEQRNRRPRSSQLLRCQGVCPVGLENSMQRLDVRSSCAAWTGSPSDVAALVLHSTGDPAEQNCGGVGPFSKQRPHPTLRVPALHTRPAPDGEPPSLRCTRAPAVEIRRHQTSGDGDGRSGDDAATGAALHSGEKRNGSKLWSCARRASGALTGIVHSPGRRSGVLRRPGGILVWPVTRSTSRSGARTFAGSPAT